jgi:hypothetical protein
MSKETALQIAMRITQRYANSLFDEHTARGRQFMQEMSECLEQERKQIENAFLEGWHQHRYNEEKLFGGSITSPKQYYNETYK